MRKCEDPLHQKLCVIGNETWPLRLIDVSATIASAGGVIFTLPCDWNFHVISHTWSGSIRELSKEVGKSIAGNPKLSYSDAFQGSSFKDDSGYKDLIQFLEVLMGDGVLKVWLDALCINQAENAWEEKDMEIRHMGAYYKHSAGCYVVLHGFGEGFDLLKKPELMDSGRLPRWFSRVWTLQEFLLPRKLTFVVSRPSTTAPYCVFCTSEEGKAALAMGGETAGIPIELKFMVETCMAGHSTIVIDAMKELFQSTGGFLDMLETLAGAEGIQAVFEDMNAEPAHTHLSKVVGNVMEVVFCTTPHNITSFRKAKNCDQQLYFVERPAYELMAWLQDCPLRIPTTRHSGVGLKKWQACLSELFRLLGECYICASYKVLDMIQSRDCSEEEDRVLSILSLLGLEPVRMGALRTGQGLEEQVVKLAQELATVNPRLLLEMCAKDVTSSPHKGLSWMPNLGAPDHMNPASRHTNRWRMRHARVHLKEVTSEGVLRLEGHVVSAHLVVGARGPMEQHFNEANCYTCLGSNMHNGLDPKGERLLVHQMQDCHLEVPQALSIPLHATAFLEATTAEGITGRGCSIRLDTRYMRDFCPDCDEIYAGGLHLPIPCLHFMPPLDLILLLWAEVEGGDTIVMLCMIIQGLQLHKIGMVRIAQEVSKAIFFKPTSEYYLGGCERDHVVRFWRELGAIQRSIPCNCSRTIIMKARRSFLGILTTKHKHINPYCNWKKHVCDSLMPEDTGPVEGLSISRPSRPICPSHRREATAWLRQRFLQQRIDYLQTL